MPAAYATPSAPASRCSVVRVPRAVGKRVRALAESDVQADGRVLGQRLRSCGEAAGVAVGVEALVSVHVEAEGVGRRKGVGADGDREPARQRRVRARQSGEHPAQAAAFRRGARCRPATSVVRATTLAKFVGKPRTRCGERVRLDELSSRGNQHHERVGGGVVPLAAVRELRHEDGRTRGDAVAPYEVPLRELAGVQRDRLRRRSRRAERGSRSGRPEYGTCHPRRGWPTER